MASRKYEKLKRQKDIAISDIKNETAKLEVVSGEAKRVAEVSRDVSIILGDLDKQFEICTGLNSLDISILFLATALQIVRQYFLTNFPERVDDQTAAKNTKGHKEEHSNRHHRYYNPTLDEIISNPVPFDANDGANGALKGGGSRGHRVTALGHDPILGLFVGTSNIATSTLTNKDLRSYHIYTNTNTKRDYFKSNADTFKVFSKTADKLLNQGLSGKQIIGVSLVKEIIHLKSDLNTENSLPLPIISVIDSQMAASLADRGLDMSNIVAVGKQATYTIIINTLISMFHSLFYDESQYINRKVYEVKTRKILSYSNIIASTSNLIYVGGNMLIGNENALKNLDIGGLLVTIYRVVTDGKFIQQIKQEFLEKEFYNIVMGEEIL